MSDNTTVEVSPIVNQEVKIGNISAVHDGELGATHYFANDADENDANQFVESYVSDEAKGLGLSFKDMKSIVQSELERIKSDPYGGTSVDPDIRSSDFERVLGAKRKRTINILNNTAQRRISEPILIRGYGWNKSVGRKFSDLTGQYIAMRQFQRASEKLMTPEQRDILRFVKAYGAITLGRDDYFFQEYIEDGRHLQEFTIDSDIGRRLSNIYGGKYPYGFMSIDENPRMLDVFPELDLQILKDPKDGHGYIGFSSLRDQLRRTLNLPVDDIHGGNILWRTNGVEEKEYVIIDQPYIHPEKQSYQFDRQNRIKMR